MEGQNLFIERRYAEGKEERLPQLATEVVNYGVKVNFAIGPRKSRRRKGNRQDSNCFRWRRRSHCALASQEFCTARQGHRDTFIR